MKISSRHRTKLSVRAACAALAALAMAACGGSGAIKPAKLTDFKPTGEARVMWRVGVGDSRPYVFSPAVFQGAVFAASHAGQLVRVDATSGKQIWRVNTKAKLSGGVGAEGDIVLVGSEKGVVLAYSLDGKELWRAHVTSEVLAPPRVAQGIVVVRSGDGKIFGLDAATGERKWEHQVTLPPLILRSQSGVTFAGDLVLAGLPGGRLLALNLATGAEVWEAVIAQPKGANELERITDIGGTPVLVDAEKGCAVAYQGRVACVDLSKGTLVWGRDASSADSAAADRSTLYITDPSGVVTALDRESGATLWKQQRLLNRRVTGPTSVENFVIVGDYQGYVHVLHADDGLFVARTSTDGSAIGSEPLRVGSNVIVQTNSNVFAIAIK